MSLFLFAPLFFLAVVWGTESGGYGSDLGSLYVLELFLFAPLFFLAVVWRTKEGSSTTGV